MPRCFGFWVNIGTIGVILSRTGFLGILYYDYSKEPQNGIGNI